MIDRSTSATGARPRWLPALAVLVLSVLAAVLGRFVPVVTTADGSSAAPAVGTGWIIALPLVVALIMTTICGDGTLGVIAGAGAVAVGRLLSDVGLFLSPDAVLRPELLGVSSVSAFPLTATTGASLPVGADLLAVAAAVLAARHVLDGLDLPDLGAPTTDVRDRPRAFRVTPATAAGLVAVVLVIAASLGVQYASPVPIVRPLGLADIGLFGAAGAVAGGLVLCLVAVVGPALSPRSARGVFLGAGAAAAVAPLTALLAGGDTRPSGLAWLGVAGAVLLALTGLLVRDPAARVKAGADDLTTVPRDDARDADGGGPGTLTRLGPVVAAVVALLAGGAALLAYREPQATTLLGEQPASFDAAGAAFLPAAVVLLGVGVLALLPPTAAIGRIALRLGWLPVVAAVLITLEFSASSIWVSSAVFTSGGVTRAAGSWWGLAAAGLAVVAAVLAAVVDAELADRDTGAGLDPADESGALRRLRTGTAWVLTVLIVLACAVPVFGANDRPSAALFAAGSRVDTYAAWLLAVGLVAGCWAGCLSRSRRTSATLLGTVAAVALTRAALTPAVQHQVRFEVRTGFALALLVAAAAAAVAVLLTLRTAPVAAPAPRPAPPGPRVRAGAPRGKRV